MLLNAPVSSNSRAVIRHPLDLATHVGLKTYNRTFRRVEAGLFLADVVAHLQGRASDAYLAEIEQVNAAIARELDRLAALVTSQARWIENVLKKHSPPPGAGDDVIAYTQPVRVELTLRTPRARRYAELLARLEETLRALDAAWYAGAIATPAQLQGGNLLFRHFHRGCGVIERLARGLARRVRDDGEAPGYRDMLVKRTGRGPERDESPAVTDEGAAAMTAGEVESLQATEALVADLSAAPAGYDPTAPDRSLASPVRPAAGVGMVGAGADPDPAKHPTPETVPEAGESVEPDMSAGPSGEEDAVEEGTAGAEGAPSEEAASTTEANPAEPLAADAAGTRRRRLREVLGGARATG